jgi:hypothetical protein
MNNMNIDVITAPEHKFFSPNTLKIFLAGGICKCIQWQPMVIDKLLNDKMLRLSYGYDTLHILNPRRVDWIEEPGAAEKQIEWEFDMLEKCDMFTMYFAGGESDQPICMYELGRNIETMKKKFATTWPKRIVITCDSSYKRVNDVIIQTRLATEGKVTVNVVDGAEESVEAHYKAIANSLSNIYCK